MGLDDEIWIVDFLRAVIVFMFAAWLVDNCNCISIMWSPSLIVRLRGAAPERKSFTCNKQLVRNATQKGNFCEFGNIVVLDIGKRGFLFLCGQPTIGVNLGTEAPSLSLTTVGRRKGW